MNIDPVLKSFQIQIMSSIETLTYSYFTQTSQCLKKPEKSDYSANSEYNIVRRVINFLERVVKLLDWILQ